MENTNIVGKVGKGYATFRINSLEGLYFVALAKETNSQKEPMFKQNENEVPNITRDKTNLQALSVNCFSILLKNNNDKDGINC